MCPSALAATSGMSGNATFDAEDVGVTVPEIGGRDASAAGEVGAAGGDARGVHADNRTMRMARFFSGRPRARTEDLLRVKELGASAVLPCSG
jgi:hypothetical protein